MASMTLQARHMNQSGRPLQARDRVAVRVRFTEQALGLELVWNTTEDEGCSW